jgi:hypothetical protein
MSGGTLASSKLIRKAFQAHVADGLAVDPYLLAPDLVGTTAHVEATSGSGGGGGGGGGGGVVVVVGGGGGGGGGGSGGGGGGRKVTEMPKHELRVDQPGTESGQTSVKWDSDWGTVTLPFVMAAINCRVVRRSLCLRNEPARWVGYLDAVVLLLLQVVLVLLLLLLLLLLLWGWGGGMVLVVLARYRPW